MAVSTLAIYLLGALFWLGILVSFIYAGSIIGAILWIVFGTAVTAIVFGLLAMPVTLIGIVLMSLGEKLKQPDRRL